jgi:hypothetical protein
MCTNVRKAPKGTAKAKSGLSKSIRQDRQTIEEMCVAFKARWAKVYPAEFKAQVDALTDALKSDPKNKELRRAKWALDQIAGIRKQLRMSDEVVGHIETLHNSGLTIDKFDIEAIEAGLANTKWLNDEGQICEKKKNRETGEHEWKPIEKWTEAKFIKVVCFAAIDIECEVKVSIR